VLALPGQEPKANRSAWVRNPFPETSASSEAIWPAHALVGGRAVTPLEQFQAMKTNTRLCAAWWIVHGSPHPQEHWVITEKLALRRKQVTAERVSEELRVAAEKVLAPPTYHNKKEITPDAQPFAGAAE
jgi:hypothetical protein